MDRKSINHWTRWLHLYLSMFSFTALLFFSVTGFTLNHPSLTDGEQNSEKLKGYIDPEWISGTDTLSVKKNQIVKYFRDNHRIRAGLTEFSISDTECYLSFNGPGYNAYSVIDRSNGSYDLMISKAGLIAKLNDLHKGRVSGLKWRAVIDVTAAVMTVVSLTGFIMIFFITKRRPKGLLIAILGTVTFVLLSVLFV